MGNKLIYWGATGQTIVLHDFLSEKFEAIAIFDQNTQLDSPFKKIPIFYGKEGFVNWFHHLKDDSVINFVIGIGGGNGFDRLEIAELLKQHGLKPITAIHPKSVLSKSAIIGEGNQILMGACVSARAEIGSYTIINTNASIDHECKIGAGCHVGPGATLAGNVEMGNYSFIGAGAVVLPRLKIGNNCLIGAGSIVTKNLPDNVIAYGNPCKIKRIIESK